MSEIKNDGPDYREFYVEKRTLIALVPSLATIELVETNKDKFIHVIEHSAYLAERELREKYEKALRFYADGSKYQGCSHDPHYVPTAIEDCGFIARQTLEKS